MVDFVRALSEEEDYELRRAIAEALVLPDDEAPLDSMATDANREIDGLQYEIAQLRQQLKEKAEELEEATNRVAALEEEKKAAAVQGTVELVDDRELREELAAAKREEEIYKGLYEDMLARALG